MNCTQLRKVYPHGVGRVRAHDSTSGDLVTTFEKSDKLYARADAANGALGRDNDKIACDKA